MELIQLEGMDDAEWDEAISRFEVKFLFHQSAWLRFLQRTQRGRVLRMRIDDKGDTMGYFAGMLVKRGPFTVLGSPLPGSTTEYMGPVANQDLHQAGFLEALIDLCCKKRIHNLELRSPLLDLGLMSRYGFEASGGRTLILTLEAAGEMLRKLPRKVRYYVRKGPRDGMIVQDAVDGAFADEYFAQLTEVFARQRLSPSYPVGRVRALLDSLDRRNLFTIRARLDGKTLATGIFVHDDRRLYYWGGASWSDSKRFFPNEPIQWKAITLAAERGISEYDMGGGTALFKSKFGGREVSIPWYYRSNSCLVGLSRSLYQKGFRAIQRLKGRYWGMCSLESEPRAWPHPRHH